MLIQLCQYLPILVAVQAWLIYRGLRFTSGFVSENEAVRFAWAELRDIRLRIRVTQCLFCENDEGKTQDCTGGGLFGVAALPCSVFACGVCPYMSQFLPVRYVLSGS